jgi:hypothetical protein
VLEIAIQTSLEASIIESSALHLSLLQLERLFFAVRSLALRHLIYDHRLTWSLILTLHFWFTDYYVFSLPENHNPQS